MTAYQVGQKNRNGKTIAFSTSGNNLRFKIARKLPIILMEFIEYTPIQ